MVSERIIASGKIFELVQVMQDDGRVFEIARRAPGTRIIIADTEKRQVLLTKEFRHGLNDWDYRLPGGKVFDTVDEFAAYRESSDDMSQAAKIQAVRKAQQEAGVAISALELYKKSVLGATVEWDLYVFVATDWQLHVDGQELEEGESIEADTWVSYDEARRMILDGAMHEERIALVLLQWIESQAKG